MRNYAYINDSVHGLVLLSNIEKKIISSIGFNRLHDVYQNSTVYLTFPSNRTKRFEHSIGTMKLGSDMFYNSVLNTYDNTLNDFFEDFEKKLIDINIDINNIKMVDGNSKFENSLIPNNLNALFYDKKEKILKIYMLLIKSVRIAALLHDIGHTPFSHVIEDAIKNVYYSYKDKSDKHEFIKIMKPYFDRDKKLHESIGDNITKNIFEELYKNDKDNELLAIKEVVLNIFQNKDIFKCLHRIIDGPLDCDRLDYVTRDSINSGIDSGQIDYRRIINEMRIHKHGKDFYVFCFQEKSLNSIEDFFKRRLELYKNIIYHHRVLKTDLILKNVVKELIEKYINGKLKDNNKYLSISKLWELLDLTSEKSYNKISQWNDSYIITILRNYFFDLENNKSDKQTYFKLFEIFMGNKYSFSLIKRKEHFTIMDEAIIDKLNKYDIKCSDTEFENNKNEQNVTNMTLNFFRNNIFTNKKKSVIYNIIKNINKYPITIDKFKEEIIQIIINSIKNSGLNNISEIICNFKILNIGLNKSEIWLYDRNNNKYYIDDISHIYDILNIEANNFPCLYVYIIFSKIKDESIVNSVKKREEILKDIGSNIGEIIIKNYETFFKKGENNAK